MTAPPSPSLHRVLERVARYTDARVVLAASVVDTVDGAVLDECVVAGPGAPAELADRFDGSPMGFGREGDGAGAAELLGWDDVRRTGHRRLAANGWAAPLGPCDVHAALGLGITAAGVVVGACWVFGQRAFSVEHERWLAHATDELTAAFERRAPPGSFALLVHPDGRLVAGCRTAEAWLDQGRRRRVVIDRALRGACLGGAQLRYFPADRAGIAGIVVAEPARVRVPATSLLSPAQREIARHAAAGATVPEAARALGITTETARTHLRDAYRRLDVGSRVELAAALRTAG